eukprot:12115840-Alexandrium_andersonii.AAC.1
MPGGPFAGGRSSADAAGERGSSRRASSEPSKPAVSMPGAATPCEICGDAHHINACPRFDEKKDIIWVT